MSRSWGDAPAARTAPVTHTWTTPHRDWPVPVVLAACVVFVALLLLAVDQGRAAMCQLHADEPPSYCAGYPGDGETS